MVDKNQIFQILEDYDKNDITITTVCSHSSMQIFDGARKEGFNTLGIAVGKQPKFYDAFPKAKPDDFMVVDDYSEIMERTDELLDKNSIIIPHGSFVEYLGGEKFRELEAPTFGNRDVLNWESDRNKEREWLTSAGLSMPRLISDPEQIDEPVLVKYHGAKGGRGFFIAKDYNDFKLGIDHDLEYHIQEYIMGTRYYLHYFFSPLKEKGYKIDRGILEMLSIDRRDESNIDEMYKLGSQEELRKKRIFPSFVVTGNIPVVIRESLLPKVFDMGEKVIDRAYELFGGLYGSFCLETIVTKDLDFKVFEISSRIVAGTNPFISGSPYSDLVEDNLSTGRRIAQEIKLGVEKEELDKIVT
ncbi:MAG: formate--phosphoribosylaminoimidazolecarboxamide ligase [Candidatus Saliniplasma sp.]